MGRRNLRVLRIAWRARAEALLGALLASFVALFVALPRVLRARFTARLLAAGFRIKPLVAFVTRVTPAAIEPSVEPTDSATAVSIFSSFARILAVEVAI